ANIDVAVIGGGAVGIESDVGGQIRARLVPKLVKAFEAGVERRLTAAREAHDNNPLGIDARVLAHDRKRTIDVEDEIETAEDRLIGTDAGEATAAQAVDGERRDTHAVELSHPEWHVGPDTARTVHKDDQGRPSLALSQAELARDGDRPPV